MFGLSKGKNQTVDRTNPMTGLGLQGSTIERKNSQSRSTASNFSIGNNLQVPVQSLMPILTCMKSENEKFSKEKQSICQELSVLDSLTQKLTSQNEALRMHYHQRSADLQSLIKTLTLNSNENLTETKHLVHTYREHNCMMAKQIEEINAQGSSLDDSISAASKQLHQTSATNIKLEQSMRSRQAKNKLIEKTIKNLQKKGEESRIQDLEKQICDIQLENNALRKKNIMTLKYIRGQRASMSSEKPEVKQQAIDAIKSVKVLSNELEKMQEDLLNFNRHKQQLLLNREALEQQFQNKYSKSENQRLKLKRMAEKLRQAQIRINQTRGSIQVFAQQKIKRQEQRLKLAAQLQSKRKELEQTDLSHGKNKQQLKQQKTRKLADIRGEMAKSQLQHSQIIQKQLNPEKMQTDSIISSLKNQLSSLEQDSKQMQQRVSSSTNPLREIMRMELQLKKLKA